MNRSGGGGRVAVTGARGFLGGALSRALTAAGWSVTAVVRQPKNETDIPWDPATGKLDPARLERFDAVVHLAGESIAGVWTPARKERIMQSRAVGTRLLCDTIAKLSTPPAVLVSASAVGYYGDSGEDELREESSAGVDFLATVCRAWEEATSPASEMGVRVVRTRFGLLLDPSGGVLRLTIPIFKLGVGAKFGDGRQWMSWIWRSDAVRAILHALGNDDLVGAVNVVAPEPVRNEVFTRELARALHRPALLAVPAFALRTFTGGMADALLLSSQRVIPAALIRSGFRFEHPRLVPALAAGLD